MHKLLLGIALAVAVTAWLDASGLTQFSALPLIPLFIVFARADRLSRRDVGLNLGRPLHYGLALAHPIIVIGTLAALAAATSSIDLSSFVPWQVAANVVLLTVATFVMAIITEEGFFRGWLWASARKRGTSPLGTLMLTTAAFVIWHIPFVALSGEFHFSLNVVPYFFANATLLGLIWGLLRLASGSIVVSSAAHGLWNGLTYVLFGVGSGVGALGIRDVDLFGPEVGLFGIALNAASAAVLYWRCFDKIHGPADGSLRS
jgi:membrane protease YdiL (CAAX protease family)